MCDTAAGVTGRLGLAQLGAFLAGDAFAPDVQILSRQLREVRAFARAAQMSGWVFGPVMVAPREERVLAAAIPGAELWADPSTASSARGRYRREKRADSSRAPKGRRCPIWSAREPATAQHIGLDELLAPLATILSSSTGPAESIRR